MNVSMDFEAIRARLAKTKGKEYWRSLEELAGSEAFQESLRHEFPNGASEWSDVAGRRNFLRLMGASLALAGLTACTRQPAETIVPYVHPALGITLGVPLYFATAMPLGGAAEGLLVESQRASDQDRGQSEPDRKSTRLNSSHLGISYAVFCLKKKKK